MKKCKMCNNELTKWWQDIYCSNKCKHSDPELNAKRVRKEKNDPTKLLKCNLCGYTTKDILNTGGHALKHLKEKHNIMDSGYNNHYNIIDVPKIEMWECPLCDWKSKDIKNVSGWITLHIINTHKMQISNFVNQYPHYSILFNKQMSIINKREELTKKENSVECKMCGLKFYKLSNTHLQKHGITPSEYKKTFGIQNTSSEKTIRLQSEKSNNPEIKNKMIQSLLKTNNERFGKNSYTQTEEGKTKVRMKTIINTYQKYISSPKLLEHVELLFDISEYDGNLNHEYKFLCKKCNKEFYGKLENGRIPRCFSCYPKINKGYSNMEKEIASFIKNELGIEILENYKINNVELDIYAKDYNRAIEFDGLHWHSEFFGEKNWNYHLNKTMECEKNGIFLMHIFEDEWIHRKDTIKNKIKIAFGLSKNKIYARECEIKEITNEEKNNFLDMNHLQGTDNISMHKIALTYKNEIVSVISLTKYKYMKNLDECYEISRFATKDDIIVVGGFSKLLKYFINQCHPKSIITFADRRWSDKNNVYEKTGFKFIGYTKPSYWYFNSSRVRQHRFNYRKSVLYKKLDKFDDNLSEWKNMQINGYDRIWDCGSLKYELVIKN